MFLIVIPISPEILQLPLYYKYVDRCEGTVLQFIFLKITQNCKNSQKGKELNKTKFTYGLFLVQAIYRLMSKGLEVIYERDFLLDQTCINHEDCLQQGKSASFTMLARVSCWSK